MSLRTSETPNSTQSTAQPTTQSTTQPTTLSPPLRGAQLLAAFVDGVALSTVVIHGVLGLALTAGEVSVMMAGGAAIAMITAPLSGPVLDIVGLRCAAAVASLLTAASLIGYATVSAPAALGLCIAGFMSAQAIGGAARHGMATAGTAPEHRVSVRASMQTLFNVGIGGGTVIGMVLIAHDAAMLRWGYFAVAALSVVGAALVLRLPSAPATPSERGQVLLALRDRRFSIATALAVLIQLTMPILSVLIPLWTATKTTAPEWTAAAALALNTVVVIIFQRPWSRLLRTRADTVRSCVVAGASFVLASFLLAITSQASAPLAVVLILAGVIVLTVGEIAGGTATWRIALDSVPEHAEGRYQSAFSFSTSGARLIGPLAAVPLVMSFGVTGWMLIGAVMAMASVGLAALAQLRPGAQNTTKGISR